MTPYIDDQDFTLYVGDVRDVLAGMPAESVHCVVTSPPYWGLRDYGTGSWDGGDDGCDHVKTTQHREQPDRPRGWDGAFRHTSEPLPVSYGDVCGKCGARRVDHQLGLEPTPEEYVANMVAVFREVRRVLRRDGTCWLNIGDSYAHSMRQSGAAHAGKLTQGSKGTITSGFAPLPAGMKEKDLVGIPWRLAFALQQPYYTGTIKDERDRIWLAAMVEAEGCMFLHKRGVGQYASSFTKQDGTESHYHRKNATFGAGLEVASTDRAIVERCLAIAGKGSIGEQTRGRKRTLYRWMLRSNECRDVIRELYPHFVVKHHEARLLIGCPSSGEKAEAAWAGLKEIHGGGVTAADFAAPESLFEPGWYVRSDIVWSKLNPMPESVRDRPTKAHEYLFLLTRSPRYFYDADAIREPHSPDGRPNGGRNKRSVWEIATEPYPDAHFATFPQALVEPCVLAGTSERGCCPVCGAPWERETDVSYEQDGSGTTGSPRDLNEPDGRQNGTGFVGKPKLRKLVDTTGWRPTCEHGQEPAPCTVLDPFMGSGTTALVARRHGRRSIGIELNGEYAKLAAARLQQLSLLAEPA